MVESDPVRRAAVDDGEAVTRVAWYARGQIHTHAIASRIEAGVHYRPSAMRYASDGEWLTVGPVSRPEPTHGAHYRYSAVNRAAIAHVLGGSGVGQSSLEALGVMLAFEDYYTDTDERIAARQRAIAKPVRGEGDPVGATRINAEAVRVYPGTLSAWIDQRLGPQGEVMDGASEPAALIDIGWRTTRRVVVDPATGRHSAGSSGVEAVGVITAAKAVKRAVEAVFEHPINLPVALAHEWLETDGWIVLGGARFDARAVIAEALDALADRVARQCPGDIDPVFIGGGASLLGERLIDRCGGRIVDEPAFAAVRGALKHMLASD